MPGPMLLPGVLLSSEGQWGPNNHLWSREGTEELSLCASATRCSTHALNIHVLSAYYLQSTGTAGSILASEVSQVKLFYGVCFLPISVPTSAPTGPETSPFPAWVSVSPCVSKGKEPEPRKANTSFCASMPITCYQSSTEKDSAAVS